MVGVGGRGEGWVCCEVGWVSEEVLNFGPFPKASKAGMYAEHIIAILAWVKPNCAGIA